MLNNIYLIRSAPYDYLIPGMNLYKSFDLVGKGEYEVKISPKNLARFAKQLSPELKDGVVFCSPRLRSIQTAQLLSSQPILVEKLGEVTYTMEEFISEAEFFNIDGSPNVTRARKAFVHALISNQLSESYAAVIERIEWLIARVAEKPEKMVMVSHGFFIKIFEAYVRDPGIKKDPNKLLRYFSGETETFYFGEGIKLQKSEKGLKTVGYVLRC